MALGAPAAASAGQCHRRSPRPGAIVEVTLSIAWRPAASTIISPEASHRYSDGARSWLVPHFEKMLYDNALIAQTFIESFQATGREDHARVAADTLDYLLREMRAPGGAFYSATDADSLQPDGHAEEGFYFTWTPAEVEAAVGTKDAAVVNAYYGVTPEGNFEGRSILHTWKSHEEVAERLGTTAAAVRKTVEAARTRLYEVRQARTRPARDEKILASWNGLAISALARAGFAIDDDRYTKAAQKTAAFVLGEMRTNGRLHRVYKDGRSGGPSFLEDYAFLTAGLLDLYEADANPRWLRDAIALQAVLDEHYLDVDRGGYFKTADDQAKLLAREKPGTDGAIPAGNSVATMNLLRLAELTGDDDYIDRALLVFAAFHDAMTRRPTQLPEMLMAVEFLPVHDRGDRVGSPGFQRQRRSHDEDTACKLRPQPRRRGRYRRRASRQPRRTRTPGRRTGCALGQDHGLRVREPRLPVPHDGTVRIRETAAPSGRRALVDDSHAPARTRKPAACQSMSGSTIKGGEPQRVRLVPGPPGPWFR